MGEDAVSTLLSEAGTLMLVGMVFVFIFLTMLIGGIEVIARFCRRFPGQQPEPVSAEQVVQSAPKTGADDPRLVAAITAAIHTHRQSR